LLNRQLKQDHLLVWQEMKNRRLLAKVGEPC